MKHIILVLMILICAPSLWPQAGVDRLVDQIEKNNPTLKALAQQRDAEKTGARLGLYPENPAVEVGMLRGSPAGLGRRADLSISQTFDFPTAYAHRSRLAAAAGRRLDWAWDAERRVLLLEARLLALDLVFANALSAEWEKRTGRARELAEAVETKFARGEANILDRNRAELTLLEAEKEAEGNEIERRSIRAELIRLNGGLPVELSEARFELPVLPSDFPAWCAKAEELNPESRGWRSEAARLDAQAALNRSLAWPKLSVGYMSESVTGERFSGVTAGVTIPLLENKNTVVYAKRSAEAARSLEADARRRFRGEMEALYEQATALRRATDGFRSRLRQLDNAPLLKKALELGQISVTEYLLELSLYNGSVDRLLEMERSLAQTAARLLQYGN
ncbi:MAG: TolC family protein [Candidatus Aminicenantes bacterium]|nr:TolC family protein [Candidatus Aminicenantes bacterium]